MTYRRNFFSYFNFLGISFCIFIAWASYFGYKSLVINGLLAFFVFCVLKCVMFAKFKNDILENDTPFLFKLSNHVFGIMFIIMDLFIFLYKSLISEQGESHCDRCHQMQKSGAIPNKHTSKGESSMKLAVTYENGQIFQHFGHTEQFKIYEVADGKIVSEEVVDTNGSGHGALAGFLMQHGVEALICGGIGGGAQAALAEVGIKLYGGVSGEADAAVHALLAENLGFNPDVQCSHHNQKHGDGGHTCGSHGCGNHGCH